MNSKFKTIAVIFYLCFAQVKTLMAQSHQPNASPAQISLFYPIGTQGTASDSISYNVSLNLLWGLTGGIRGAELGGLFNKTKGAMSGAQFGGLGNFVDGDMTGGQFSGLMNTATSLKGAQIGGLINSVNNTPKVHQSDTIEAIASPIYENNGVQAAGLLNQQAENMKGVQIAGLINLNRQHIKGVQLSGLLNKTKSISGVQIGLINIADTITNGVPIGLINIVKSNAYKATEVEVNESFYANVSYKMGVKRFYSIFSLAFTTQNQKEFWALGFGFGTSFAVNNITGIHIDAVNYHLNEGEWWTNNHNQLNKLKINCSFQLAPKLSVFGGFSANVLISEIKNKEGIPTGSHFKTPNAFYEKVNSSTKIVIYPGLNAGIRF